MSTERLPNINEGEQEELLRLAYDAEEADELPVGLRERLAGSGSLRREFEETRELLRELRDVLGPQPLSDALIRQIHGRMEESAGSRGQGVLRPFRMLSVAAAAAVVALLVLGRLGAPPASSPTPAAPELTNEDATSIVSACRLLGWNGREDYSLQRVSDRIEEVEQQIEAGPASHLPWRAEDDWDRAPEGRGSGALRSKVIFSEGVLL